MLETQVDQIIQDELVKTEWFNGTLFVSKINESQARQIFHRLGNRFGLGSVMVHQVGNEYAYDFIATEEFSPYATVNS